jgi:hypothetical protein
LLWSSNFREVGLNIPGMAVGLVAVGFEIAAAAAAAAASAVDTAGIVDIASAAVFALAAAP